MNKLGTAWSAATIAWISALLQERYGNTFILELDESGWKIAIEGAAGGLYIAADAATFHRADSDLPFTTWDAHGEGWVPVLSKPLPMPGAALLSTPVIEKVTDGYAVHYDILGLAYWMLTRQEEVGRTDLDEHGRFPAKSSHAFKHGYLERPVVDEWLDILGQVIKRTWPNVQLKEHLFNVKVSHDVDRPSRYGFKSWKRLLLSMGADTFQHYDMRGLLAPWIRLTTKNRLHPLDVFNTFDWLMDLAEAHGRHDAFYFICGQKGTPFNPDYDLEHQAIRDLIRRIHARGHEVGLHPSYNTFLNPTQIKSEFGSLQRVCAEEGVKQANWGGRMHYLQWRMPDTLRAWNDAGMAYDSTMAYADHAGFRCGTCFEYPAFDPVAQKVMRLRMRPLVVMEGSVIDASYMGLGVSNAAAEKMLELKRACRAVKGGFTLLWHNSSFRSHDEKDLYKKVLEKE